MTELSQKERPISAVELVVVGAKLGMLIETLREAIGHLVDNDQLAAQDKLVDIDEQMENLATDFDVLIAEDKGNRRDG